MLKTLRFGAAIVLTLTTQIALPVAAAPQKTQANTGEEIYVGVFGEGKDYARNVYLIPNSIRKRGDLRRFQKHDIYRQQQTSAKWGYKYVQTVGYWVANCQDGSIGVQKAEHFDAQGNPVGELTLELELKVPDPGSTKEKALDFVCDYEQ